MKKNQILDSSISNLFLAPESDTISAGAVDVPVIDSPAGPAITEVVLPIGGAKEISAVKSLGLDDSPDDGVRGPADIFGDDESPDAVTARLEESSGMKPTPKRGEDGKFLPADDKKAAAKPAAKKEEAKPAAKATPTAKTTTPPVTKPSIAEKPAEPQKIKIGDEEKTAEEWAKHYADLKAKAEGTQQPAKADEKQDDTKATEKQTAEAKEREQAFIKRTAAENYALTEDEMDTILSGGPEAASMFAQKLASAEMRARQFAANASEQLFAEIAPILEQQRLIAQYQAEHSFLAANPDINGHAEGLATYRYLANQMESGFQDIQTRAEQGKATPQEQLWAQAYADLRNNPEQLRSDLAYYTREALKLPAPGSAQAIQQQQQVKPAPAKKEPAERPLSGDRPGGATPTRTESSEARLARELREDAA